MTMVTPVTRRSAFCSLYLIPLGSQIQYDFQRLVLGAGHSHKGSRKKSDGIRLLLKDCTATSAASDLYSSFTSCSDKPFAFNRY